MIESVSHEALVKWKRDRRDYESKMQARCRVTGEDYDAVVQSIRDSFEPRLLEVFCQLQLNVEPADATERMLTAEIEHIVSSIKNATLPDIKELFKKELRMKKDESDVNARLMDYYKHFNTIVEDNGLTECFSGVAGTKEKCKRLISSLWPKSLKDEVKQCVRFTHIEAAKDPRALFRLILEKATEFERQHQRLRLQKCDAIGQGKENPKPPQSAKPKRRWEEKTPVVSTTTSSMASARGAKTDRKSKPPSSSKPPPGPCPKCQEMHWLRECPAASRKDKEEFWTKIKNARNKKAKLKRLGELLPSPERVVTLNGKLELPYCPDTGSDYTVIGHSHWNELKALDSSVVAVELEGPILNQTFGSTTVTAKYKAKIHVMIHTVVGPVEPMAAVDVLVLDVDDGEFIIGNDLLTSLGIDVDRQLQQLAMRSEDETSGDPIDLEADEMHVKIDGSVPSGSDDIFALWSG
ncbi:hypothetical protein PR002_g2909 [Phytophthora rubi]|uniref:Uncharacterized protein n=1 Tax=Phytophthora rubi TaxID=129364 RepID=A0A6A3NFI7_9STRA|nr:hypothetical protein PR002_g2909 [Phytophthora rubi]